jgi:hypothetical protein
VSVFVSCAESRSEPQESRIIGKSGRSLAEESPPWAVPELELPAAAPLLWPPLGLESRDESLSRSCRFTELEPMPDELLLALLEGPNPPPPLWLLLEEEIVELELLDGLGDAL